MGGLHRGLKDHSEKVPAALTSEYVFLVQLSEMHGFLRAAFPKVWFLFLNNYSHFPLAD